MVIAELSGAVSMKEIYIVTDTRNGTVLGAFPTEKLAELSLDITYAGCVERRGECEVSKVTFHELATHL